MPERRPGVSGLLGAAVSVNGDPMGRNESGTSDKSAVGTDSAGVVPRPAPVGRVHGVRNEAAQT